ncbi:MAG: type II secretion system secretin GspD [Chromatocurvus sp.]
MLQKTLVTALCLALAGCAAGGGEQPQMALPGEDSEASETARVVDAERELSATAQALAEERRSSERSKPRLYPGTGPQVRLPQPSDPVRFVGDDVSLNFEQAPLDEIVQAIMGDILELDYLIDHPVQGKVTLRTRTPIPRDELLGVLESLLKAHNALLIRGRDGRYMVTGSQQAMRLDPQVTSAADEYAGYSTIIVPLQYISASAMADILEPVAESSSLVRIDNARNLIMLAGTRAQLTGWLDIVSTFDVDMLKGMSVGLFPLENASVMETTQAVNELLAAAGSDGGDITRLVRVLPMERLNSVLAITPREHYLNTVKEWIERFDIRPDEKFEKRLHVYPVQNTTAERLSQLLNSIYSGGSGGQASVGAVDRNRSAGGSGVERGVAPGMSPESFGSGSSSSGGFGSGSGSASGFGASGSSGGASSIGSGASSRRSGGGSSNNSSTSGAAAFGGGAGAGGVGAGGAAGGMTATDMGGSDEQGTRSLADVRVVADEVNNSLMIYATGQQYEIIEDALKQLDTVATQVIIEASIMEVTLTDELRYGLEWVFKNGIDGGYDGRGSLAGQSGNPTARSPGFSYTVTNGIGDISAVLNALSQDSLLNVISTPSIMVLDNYTAEIQVGDQVPVLQGQTIGIGGNSVQNITFRDTGVSLVVTPSVNAGGLITMDVQQSVTDVGNVDDATGQRTFLNRAIRSRVAVRSSESVVLGGLIRENASRSGSGVPLIRDIPVLGNLFGSRSRDNTRTELLVIITPRAIFNEDELREVSKDMRSQIRFMELIDTDSQPAPVK